MKDERISRVEKRILAEDSRLNHEFRLERRNLRLLMWLLVMLVMLDYALQGYQEPWSFGYFQYALTWENGYLPRGFTGTVLHFLLGDGYYQTNVLRMIIVMVGLLFFIWLAYASYRLIVQSGNLVAVLVIAIFSASFLCMFYLAENGFLDHIGYLLAIIHIETALRCSLKTTMRTGAVLALLSVFVLETNGLIICPIIGSVCLIRLFEEDIQSIVAFGKAFLRLAIAFIPTIIAIIAFKMCHADAATCDQWLEQAKRFPFYTADFPAWMAFFHPDAKATAASLEVKGWLYLEPHILTYCLLVIGVMDLFLYWVHVEKKIILVYTGLSLLSGGCAYSAMYFGGSDFHRYWFSMFMSVFLISLYILLRYRNRYISWAQGVCILTAAVLIIPRASGYRLWHWDSPYNSSPFVRLIDWVLSAIT